MPIRYDTTSLLALNQVFAWCADRRVPTLDALAWKDFQTSTLNRIEEIDRRLNSIQLRTAEVPYNFVIYLALATGYVYYARSKARALPLAGLFGCVVWLAAVQSNTSRLEFESLYPRGNEAYGGTLPLDFLHPMNHTILTQMEATFSCVLHNSWTNQCHEYSLPPAETCLELNDFIRRLVAAESFPALPTCNLKSEWQLNALIVLGYALVLWELPYVIEKYW
jgi:hypothetical protein